MYGYVCMGWDNDQTVSLYKYKYASVQFCTKTIVFKSLKLWQKHNKYSDSDSQSNENEDFISPAFKVLNCQYDSADD